MRPLAYLLCLFALPLSAAGAIALTRPNPIRSEAESIFAYDRAHPHQLPAHRLRALSLALEFRDDAGASALIAQLKKH